MRKLKLGIIKLSCVYSSVQSLGSPLIVSSFVLKITRTRPYTVTYTVIKVKELETVVHMVLLYNILGRHQQSTQQPLLNTQFCLSYRKSIEKALTRPFVPYSHGNLCRGFKIIRTDEDLKQRMSVSNNVRQCIKITHNKNGVGCEDLQLI